MFGLRLASRRSPSTAGGSARRTGRGSGQAVGCGEVRLPGPRKEPAVAAGACWRVMRAVMEGGRRGSRPGGPAAADETLQALGAEGATRGADGPPVDEAVARERIAGLRAFFGALDAGLSGMSRGEVFVPDSVRRTLVRIAVEDSG